MKKRGFTFLRKLNSTKEKILYILKKESEVTMKDLMDYFTISEIAVRKHLRELLAQDFIQEKTVKQEVGRPFHLYSLTGKGHGTFPNQYDELPLQLLKDLEELQGKSAVEELLRVRKKREQTELVKEVETLDFDQKIIEMIKHQEKKGYMIEHEKTEQGGYEIKNFNCPIYNISSNYTQVCDNEKKMYEHLFPESNIQVNQCMSRGAKYCYWYINRPE